MGGMSGAACEFCAIAEGRAEASVVWSGRDSIAFLDRRPLFPGHCLLIPRAHVETLTDAPGAEVAALFVTARLLASAVERGLAAEGSFVAVNNRISQSVPHLHIHIVPRRKGDGLKGFFWPRRAYRDNNEMEAARRAIAQFMEGSKEPARP
jgi:histidine triad (HIT) family protein